MIHTEYEWISHEKKRIYAQSWVPEGKITGIINLVHGLGEHSGRYAHWASLFAEKGWGVLTFDLVGNGRSEGKRGHIKNYQVFLNQVDLLLQKSEELFPGKPRILYGHSMGGNLVINYSISRDPAANAMIATSPWLKLAIPIPPIQLALIRFMNKLMPWFSTKWPKNPEHSTHDPEIWADIRNDPLNHGYVSIRLVNEIYNHGLFALRHVYKINKSFLLMHGSGDKVTSHKASEDFVANTSDRTQLRIWDGLYHELHNEFEHREIFEYIMSWINGLKIK